MNSTTIKDLFCAMCTLKFDKKAVYDISTHVICTQKRQEKNG